MPGLFQMNNVSYDNITSIANVTNPSQFIINVNQIIFDGWLYFALVSIIWVIIFFALNSKYDDFITNMIGAGTVCTILSIFLRAHTAMINGLEYALINDWQLWIFPIVTLFFVFAGYINKQ